MGRAFTENLAIFNVAPDRHEDHARALPGDYEGIVTSDRWWPTTTLPLDRRQICWSHLRRDFQAQAEDLDAQAEFGAAALTVCQEVF